MEIVKMVVVLDYAPHTLAAQRYLHEMGDALRRNQFKDAAEEITQAIVELRLALAAVHDMHDRSHRQER
jgi:hypothetical protein